MKIRVIVSEDFIRLIQGIDVLGTPVGGQALRQLDGVDDRLAYLQVRDVTIVALMGEAGLRLGELQGLGWGDLVHHAQVKGIVGIRSLKSRGQVRDVPLSGMVLASVERLRVYDFRRWGAVKMEDPVFRTWRTGSRLGRRAIQRMVEAAGEEVLGRRIWCHLLRHTFATRLVKVCDIRTVQNVLGHSRLDTTQRYTHPGLTEAVEGIRRLAEG